MVSLFYSGSIFYNKSIIQNVYFIYFLTKNPASAENFAYTADILSLRVCGAQVKKTKGEQVTVCFLCGEEIFKNNNTNNRSLKDLCFRKVGELSYSFK